MSNELKKEEAPGKRELKIGFRKKSAKIRRSAQINDFCSKQFNDSTIQQFNNSTICKNCF